MPSRIITVLLALVTALSLTGVFVGTAAADTDQRATIVHTEIGIMFRANPDDWSSHIGPAGYDGDTAILHCERMGAPVGDKARNHSWYWATTSHGTGWLPDHYLDTPVVANQWLPGLQRCNGKRMTSSKVSLKTNQPPVRSVFFSPNGIPTGLNTVRDIADKEATLDRWRQGGCSAAKAAQNVPPSANTLAGWSLGRLGPAYFLAAASPAQKSKIHALVLFDPGNTRNFSGQGACDKRYNINVLLAQWLKSDGRNRLVIFTGAVSEEANARPVGSAKSLVSGGLKPKLTFAGLWHYYLAGIWNQPFADRAQICDYRGMAHETVLRNFAWTVRNMPTRCPSGGGQKPVAWHP